MRSRSRRPVTMGGPPLHRAVASHSATHMPTHRHTLEIDPVTLTASARIGILGVALVTAVLALALALSPQAGARARGAACTHSAQEGHPRGTHSCLGAGDAGRSSHRHGKSHAHSRTGRHHPKHGSGHHGGAQSGGRHTNEVGTGGEEGGSGEAQAPGPLEALCEDGSAPEAEGGGTFTCEDGSEPSCAEGLEPVLSSDGSQLLCETSRPPRRGSAEVDSYRSRIA
jgi:hypothetical protein